MKRMRLEKQSAVRIQRAFRYSRAKRRLAQMVGADEEAAATPSGWVEMFDEASGYVYYYHTGTAESVWERPAEMDQSGASPDAASTGEWVEYWDENVGASYFYNVNTGEATWTTPTGYHSNQEETTAETWPMENGNSYYASQSRSKLQSMGPEYAETPADTGNQQLEAFPPDGNQYYGYGGDQWGDNGDGGYYYYYGDSAAGGAAYTYPVQQDGSGLDDNDVFEPVDTEYDINYKIYLTQLDREQQQRQQEQPDDQDDQQNQTTPDGDT